MRRRIPPSNRIGRTLAAALVVVLVAGSAVGTAAAATPTGRPADASGSTYAGAHVSFHASGNALSNYAVENATVFDSVKVGSASSQAGVGSSLGSSLSATTHVSAAGLSVASKTRTSATLQTQSGATVRAHDDGHGILTVHAGGSNQTVVANLTSGSSASAQSDNRVAVTTSDGTKGTFIVVGNGSVAVNDAGNVTASLGPHATLAYRAYPNGKTKDDARTEKLIANGTAAAEVSVSNRGGSTATDAVNYTSDFSASARQSASNQVTVTADNAHHDGKVVVTSVSKQAVGTLSNLSVAVDGQAAARASSYSALRAATAGDQSKYLVRQSSSSSASASATVYVAFNHFSTRHATITGNRQDASGTTTTSTSSGSNASNGSNTSNGSTTDNGSASGTTASNGSSTTASSSTTSTSSPGFGVAAGALALVAAAVAAFRRRT